MIEDAGGDVNVDGAVTSLDLGQLLNNFNFDGTAPAASAVPEPTTISLLFRLVGVQALACLHPALQEGEGLKIIRTHS